MGRPRQVGFIAMGQDVVAVDATCARIIGLDASKMNYLRVASKYWETSPSRASIASGKTQVAIDAIRGAGTVSRAAARRRRVTPGSR